MIGKVYPNTNASWRNTARPTRASTLEVIKFL
jgi:hypothetical protein